MGLCLVLIPLAIWVGESAVELALLIGSVMLVPIIELINSALEAAVDRISDQHHELSGRAKDMGSAAVFGAILITVVIWSLILFD